MQQRAITSGDPLGFAHLRALDGLRAVAVTLVFLFHLPMPHTPASLGPLGMVQYVVARSWIGVDIFFVLSGFLITSVLLKARQSSNYFSVFYARRALRIFPLYYLAVGLVFLLNAYPLRVQLWFWLNACNLNTWRNSELVPLLTHFWSLATEEQFYLLWPLLVRKLSTRVLCGICLCTIPLEYGMRLLPWVRHMDALPGSNFTYRLAPFHSEGLFLGALLALLVSSRVIEARHLRKLRVAAACSAVAVVLVLTDYSQTMVWSTRLTFSVLAIASTCIVALLLFSPGGFIGRVLSSRPMTTVGRYSFCMYVVHIPLLHFIHQITPTVLQLHLWGQPLVVVEMYALTFGVAAVSWRVLEEPILSLKRFFMYRMDN